MMSDVLADGRGGGRIQALPSIILGDIGHK